MVRCVPGQSVGRDRQLVVGQADILGSGTLKGIDEFLHLQQAEAVGAHSFEEGEGWLTSRSTLSTPPPRSGDSPVRSYCLLLLGSDCRQHNKAAQSIILRWALSQGITGLTHQDRIRRCQRDRGEVSSVTSRDLKQHLAGEDARECTYSRSP